MSKRFALFVLPLLLVSMLFLPTIYSDSVASITRHFDNTNINVGEVMTITIEVKLANGAESFYVFEEIIPVGWNIVSNGGMTVTGNSLKVAILFNAVDTNYTYQLRAMTPNPSYWSGEWGSESTGASTYPISGQNNIKPNNIGVYSDEWLDMIVTPYRQTVGQWTPNALFEHTFTVTNNKAQSGNLCIAYKFNQTVKAGSKIYLERSIDVNYTKSYSCNSPFFFNYTTNPRYVWCFDNSTNQTKIIFEHSYTQANVTTKTAYWNDTITQNYMSDETSHMEHIARPNGELYYADTAIPFSGYQSMEWKIAYYPNDNDITKKWDLIMWGTQNGCGCILNDTCLFVSTFDPEWATETNWTDCKNISIYNPTPHEMVNRPFEITVSGLTFSSTDEIRITDGACWGNTSEMPRDILSSTATSANVLFIANISAYTNKTFSVYYNNIAATAPSYSTDLSSSNGTYLFLNNSLIGMKIEDDYAYIRVLSYGGANWVGQGAARGLFNVANYSTPYTVFGYATSWKPNDCDVGFDGVVKKVITCNYKANTAYVLNYTLYAFSDFVSMYVDISGLNYTGYFNSLKPEGTVGSTYTWDSATENIGYSWNVRALTEKWMTVYKTTGATKYAYMLWNGSNSRYNNGTIGDVNSTYLLDSPLEDSAYVYPSAYGDSITTDGTRTFYQPSNFIFGFTNQTNASEKYKTYIANVPIVLGSEQPLPVEEPLCSCDVCLTECNDTFMSGKSYCMIQDIVTSDGSCFEIGSYNNILFNGQGHTIYLDTTGGSTDGIFTFSAAPDNFTIQNLTATYNGTTTPAYANFLYSANGINSNFTIQNIKTNMPFQILDVNGGYLFINNSNFTDCRSDETILMQGLSSTELLSAYLENILFNNCTKIVLRNTNHIFQSTKITNTNGQYGIEFQDYTTLTLNNSMITGSTGDGDLYATETSANSTIRLTLQNSNIEKYLLGDAANRVITTVITPYGIVNFTQPIYSPFDNLATSNLTKDISIKSNYISVDSDNAGLNASAYVQFYNLPTFSAAGIKMGGVPCTGDMCQGLSYSSAEKQANVTITDWTPKYGEVYNLNNNPTIDFVSLLTVTPTEGQYQPTIWEVHATDTDGVNDISSVTLQATDGAGNTRNSITTVSTICYQETANVSTSCGGLATGAYSWSSEEYWVNRMNVIDGDWDTYSQTSDTNPCVIVDYTIPENTVSVLWQIKDNTNFLNITIPDSALTGINLSVKACSFTEVGAKWFIYNGSWFLMQVGAGGDAPPVYEEAMFWTIAQPASCSYQNNLSTLSSTCYQETANTLTSCGGLDTGSYTPTDGEWDGVAPVYDGDWGTKTHADGGYLASLLVNYTIPSDTTSVEWLIKDDGGTENLTILSSCLTTDVLQLKIESDLSFTPAHVRWSCFNGTWALLRMYNLTAGGFVYEEAIFWSIAGSSSNISANYTCTIPVPYYYNGTGTLNATVTDSAGAAYSNTTTTFVMNNLEAFTFSANTTFSLMYPQQTVVVPSSDPLILNNTGNVALDTIEVNAVNLQSASNIFTVDGNFTMGYDVISGSCTGTNVTNGTFVDLTGALSYIPLHTDAAKPIRNLYTCIYQVPTLQAGTYSSIWTLRGS